MGPQNSMTLLLKTTHSSKIQTYPCETELEASSELAIFHSDGRLYTARQGEGVAKFFPPVNSKILRTNSPGKMCPFVNSTGT